MGIKEVGAGIVRGKQRLFLRQHHRWQLIEVPNKEQLHTPEWGTSTGAIHTQKLVNTVEEVGADHADFIDDERLQIAIERLFSQGTAPRFLWGDIRAEPKEGMDGLAVHIDRRDPCGSEYDQALPGRGAEVLQQRGLPRPRPASEKDVLPRVFPEL